MRWKHVSWLSSLVLVFAACGGKAESKPDGADTGADGDTDTDSDTDVDTDADADTDTDADADADADADTDTYDWGETVPCPGEPQPGEVCVPGGKYLMGCVPGDTECEENEYPLVEVTLSPFFVDTEEANCVDTIEFLNTLREGYYRLENRVKTVESEELPNGEAVWNASGGGKLTPIQLNQDGDYEWIGYPNAPEEPYCAADYRDVTDVCGGFSWLGAKLFCEWKGKRLPTEAQWEAAARGQTFHEYPCGSDLPPCWYGEYACCVADQPCAWEMCMECCLPFRTEWADSCVSPCGALAMYGNAAEWVLDGIDGDHSWCAGGCTDPEPAPGVKKVTKGGSIRSGVEYTRISARKESWSSILNYNSAWSNLGVRCVRPAVEDPPDAGPDGGTDGGTDE